MSRIPVGESVRVDRNIFYEEKKLLKFIFHFVVCSITLGVFMTSDNSSDYIANQVLYKKKKFWNDLQLCLFFFYIIKFKNQNQN